MVARRSNDLSTRTKAIIIRALQEERRVFRTLKTVVNDAAIRHLIVSTEGLELTRLKV